MTQKGRKCLISILKKYSLAREKESLIKMLSFIYYSCIWSQCNDFVQESNMIPFLFLKVILAVYGGKIKDNS